MLLILSVRKAFKFLMHAMRTRVVIWKTKQKNAGFG
jgi:hypothetical protein